MGNQRQTQYDALWFAVEKVGSTPCMQCPEVFFPEDYGDRHTRGCAIEVAKALCDTCPVKRECFTYANETDQRYGIWAGTLPSER